MTLNRLPDLLRVPFRIEGVPFLFGGRLTSLESRLGQVNSRLRHDTPGPTQSGVKVEK